MSKDKVKFVTMRASSEARLRAHKIIQDVRKHGKIDGRYKFYTRPIGSQARRCIVQDKDGKYDLDYQIILTKNSPKGDDNPTQIKLDFLQAFTDCKNTNENVEDSTTVVTVRCFKSQSKFDASKEKFSFDFVIISIDELNRIKRNAKKDAKNNQNEYTWCQLPTKNSDIYVKFNKYTIDVQKEILEDYVLSKILIEKAKDESIRIPTIELFYSGINEYEQKHPKK